ncbi:putative ribonuclease H-like domain-containing protein [Tanacetum coccineum]
MQTRSKVQQKSRAHALISYIQKQQRTITKINKHCLFACFLSQEEPKKISEALQDDSWVLVDLPREMKVIGTKWVYRNKRDERGVVVRNKARMEAIRLFLAFASFMGFIVYQMDVKSVFLYGTIDEEVYVSQPPGFVDPDHLKKVYKVVKALYGLHQAPRAWYATLSTFLEKHGYKSGTIDKTLFIKRDKKDIMLVQVYVNDIIFGSTKKFWCDEFEASIKSRFQMSSMGELIFFLGLQVKHNKEGILISQDKYVAEILKKFNLVCVKTAITPMETKVALTKDEKAVDVDVTPKTSHLNAVKRIFKYLKGKPNLGLWYPRESPFDLEAFSDSDYGGSNLDRKSTTDSEEGRTLRGLRGGKSQEDSSSFLKRFEEVKEEFDKLVKQVESFAPINFEATKASLKRFGEELQTKTTKRLKDDEAKDAKKPSQDSLDKKLKEENQIRRLLQNVENKEKHKSGIRKITSANIVPPKKTTSYLVETQKPELNVYSWKPKNVRMKVIQIVLWYLDSGCSKHMTGNRSQLMNFVSKFLGIVRFGNDHIARIMRCSWCGGPFNGGNFRRYTNVSFGHEFVRNPDPISYDEILDFSYPPPQPQTYSCELCGNDSHYGYDCPPRNELLKTMQSLGEMLRQREQADNFSTHTPEPSRSFNSICYDDDDDEEGTIPLNEIISQIPPSIAITPVLTTSSVEDLIPILSEFEDTSHNDSECDLPFCNDSPPLDVLGGNSVTFSNPLFDSNDDFTSSNDESLPEEDVQEENFKIYSNLLFEFYEEYISNDINTLYNEVLKDIERNDSYVSNLDEPVLLVILLSDAKEDECFDPGGDIDEIDAFLDIDVSMDIEDGYHDLKGDIIYLESLFINDTIPNLPPEVFLDHDPRSLKDEPNIDALKIKENMRFTFEDRHYLFLTFVIQIFLPFLTYPMNSLLLLSSESEDTIFDPGISAYSFYSLEPMAYESSMMIFPFFFFCTNDKEIRGEIASDYKDSRARGFFHRSLELQSLACLFMGIRYPTSY